MASVLARLMGIFSVSTTKMCREDIFETPQVFRLSLLMDVPSATLLRFRSGWPGGRYYYRPLRCEKRDGSPRHIYAPSPPLKALQRALLSYLNSLTVHPAALGFRRGFSIADNARAHQGQAVVVTADIEDFFDSTPAQRVRDFFRAEGWDTTAVSILTRLCTFHSVLPQGAPTSPVLSNLVNTHLDADLTRVILQSGGRYSRYGDDLTFSWSTRAVPSGFEATARAILLSYGYHLNAQKGWRIWRVYAGDVAYITGIRLGLDGRLHPSSEIQQNMRELRHQRNDPVAAARLQGYQGFIKMLRS
ncbi:MAG: RNA-directed DNA polymerase [Anaerolineae bacterium]|nr:RNA-directed DNA polymerase [Anaerolineae bacterium]